MVTLAQIADELSGSPAATTRRPAAEAALQVSEQEQRLSAMVAAKDQSAVLMRLSDREDLLFDSQAARQQAAAELGLLSPARATSRLASSLAEQQERMAQEWRIAVNEMMRPTMDAARRIGESFAGLADLAGLGGALLSPAELAAIADIGQPVQRALDRLHKKNQWLEQEQRAIEHLSGSLQTTKDVFGLPDVDQMADALWARGEPAAYAARGGVLIEFEPPAWPPPPGGQPPAQPVQTAQPEQAAGWQAMLAAAMRAGQAQPDEVLRLVAEVAKLPPVAEMRAELAELEDLERAWQRAKKRQTAEGFAARHGLSRATLYRRWQRLKELRMMLEVWQ